jgi:hypothetical protein
MSAESKLYERLGVAGYIVPTTLSTASVSATSIPTDSTKMKVADKALAIVKVGAGFDATITAVVQYGSAAYNASGSATAISWTSYNSAASNSGGSSSIFGIEVDSSDMPHTHPYLRLLVTSDAATTQTIPISAVILTSENRYNDADTELDSVVEVE